MNCMNEMLATSHLMRSVDQHPWYWQLAVGLGLLAVGSGMIYGDKRMGGNDGFLWFAGFIISIAGVFQLWHVIF